MQQTDSTVSAVYLSNTLQRGMPRPSARGCLLRFSVFCLHLPVPGRYTGRAYSSCCKAESCLSQTGCRAEISNGSNHRRQLIDGSGSNLLSVCLISKISKNTGVWYAKLRAVERVVKTSKVQILGVLFRF